MSVHYITELFSGVISLLYLFRIGKCYVYNAVIITYLLYICYIQTVYNFVTLYYEQVASKIHLFTKYRLQYLHNNFINFSSKLFQGRLAPNNLSYLYNLQLIKENIQYKLN